MHRPILTAALLAGSILFGTAAATGSEQESEEPELADLSADELAVVAVRVVDRDAPCPAAGESADEPVRITRFQAICIDQSAGVAVSAGGDPVFDDSDPTKLVVADGFSWEGNVPRVLLSFEIEAQNESRTVDVALSPELGLNITFGQTPDQAASDDEADDDTTGATGGVDSEAGADESDGALESDTVVIGQNRRSKSIEVTGRDRNIAGLEVREQARAGQLRVIAEVDGDETVLTPASDGDRVNLALDDGTVTYDLALAEGANFGSTVATQETELLLGNVVLAQQTTNLQLEAPVAQVDVQALAQVVGGDDTIVSVRVTNRGTAPITGPLDITLKPIEGDGLVEGFDDVSDGTIDGNTVTWPIARDLGPGDQVVQTIQVDLNPGSAGAQIRWEGTLTRRGASVPIDAATVTTDIEQEASGSEAGVQFTPDQLIRLIAFVMAFALVAVIFGAWNRGGRRGDGEHDEEHHKHELELFRAYTEAILVLVILVAILVLALRGSLSGESAASLIGVIAGYALGRSTSGR